jgi:hypothetical protein
VAAFSHLQHLQQAGNPDVTRYPGVVTRKKRILLQLLIPAPMEGGTSLLDLSAVGKSPRARGWSILSLEIAPNAIAALLAF